MDVNALHYKRNQFILSIDYNKNVAALNELGFYRYNHIKLAKMRPINSIKSSRQ